MLTMSKKGKIAKEKLTFQDWEYLYCVTKVRIKYNA